MNKFSKYFFEGGFGLERETLRLDKNGGLARTPHPFDDPHLQRDFCENQLEIITGVNDSVKDAIAELAEWDLTARKKLSENNENLHIYSNPPYFSDVSEITVAYSGMETAKFNYRKQLEQKYGKPMMLYSGIHFNFSLSEKYLHEINDTGQEFGQFKDSTYFRLMKQIFLHSWLIVLLTAASPTYDSSFFVSGTKGEKFSDYGSLRNSKHGYWNQFVPVLDYSSIENFTDSIQGYIDDGLLLSPAELYMPVRLKPKGEYSPESLKNGIDHIELRMFDLNPLSDVGIFSKDAEFAHLLMLYLLHLPDFDFTAKLQEKAVFDHKEAAKYMPDKNYFDKARAVITEMKQFFEGYVYAEKSLEYQERKLTENQRYCVKIYERR
ncbi:MAG: glutathione synthase [Clostridium sp.]|nr:glutathione synthase [Clostridium sp.]